MYQSTNIILKKELKRYALQEKQVYARNKI